MSKRKASYLTAPSLTALSMAVALGVSASARAQESDQASSERAGLDTVVVTAERKESTQQDVPMSLQTFSADDLEKIGFTNITDIVSKAPSLTVAAPLFSQAPHTLRLYMRGVQNTGAESGVAVYFDDVYISNRSSHTMQLADVERVEILKGPQGTLYGRNAVGGAVKFISAKPTGEFGFRQQLDIGNYGYVRTVSHLNLPEVGNVSVKLSGLYNRRDGWAENTGAGPDFHEQDDKGLRAAVRWAPADNLTFDYSFDYIDIDDTPPLAQRQFDTGQFPFDFPIFPTRQDQTWRPVDTKITATALQKSHALGAEWTISENMSLRSTTAYMTQDTYRLMDSVEGYNLPNLISRGDQSKQFQQEVLLSGGLAGGALDYHFGVFYFWEETGSQAVNFVDFPRGSVVPYVPLTVADLPNPTILNTENESIAVFAQVSWTPDILDQRLRFDLGGRYTHDDRSAGGFQPSGVSFSDGSDAYSSWDPSATVDFAWTENVHTYFRFATAYRAGGFNLYPTGPFVSRPFGKEDVTSYEVGLKSELWNRVRFNLALFQSNYENIQIPVTLIATPNNPAGQEIRNVGEATIRGVEGEVELVLFEGFNLFANVNYLDTESTRVNPQTMVETEQPLPQTPAWRYVLGAEYTGPETSLGVPSLRVSYDYTDTKISPEDESLIYPQCRNLDARASLTDIGVGGGAVTAAIWGKNLTDNECQVFRGFNAVQYVTPRTYGVSFIVEF